MPRSKLNELVLRKVLVGRYTGGWKPSKETWVVRQADEKLRTKYSNAIAHEFGLHVSPLRVLEQLIWFDWNVSYEPEDGYCHMIVFPEWVYNTRAHDRGVYLMKR